MKPLSSWDESAWRDAQAHVVAPSWLADWREHQLQDFLKLGFPRPNDENWKYSQISSLLTEKFQPVSSVDSQLKHSANDIADCYRLVFIDGVFSAIDSDIQNLPQQILLTHSIDAWKQYPQLFQTINSDHKNLNLTSFDLLNGALLNDGMFLIIPDNLVLTKPIHLRYVIQNCDQTVNCPRNLIKLGKNCRLTLIEEYIGLGSNPYFNNVMTKISLGQGSHLDYYKIQSENSNAFHIGNTCFEQFQDSTINSFHIAFGGCFNREDINFALMEKGANCQLAGFYYPQREQMIDFHIRLDHFHAQTESSQYYKGIVAGKGRGVFNGKIIIHPAVKQVNAKQKNYNLLLSDSAEVFTKPELQVYSDEVQCSHGASVGHLDKDALFYLRSRGINESLAKELLLTGFVNDIFERFTDQRILDYVRNKINLGEGSHAY